MSNYTKELPKVYKPHEVEDHWINQWVEKGLFAPHGGGKGKPFCIVIPPPNVTGSLHMGHALNSTLQDILVRYRRMKGCNTLWVVGTDHAGIATQNVVERQLDAENLSRSDLGREKFIERVWKWRRESGGIIINQLKRLGASCDYAHERFTMDEGLSNAVRKVFVSLYNDGLIYRGLRLINWCPRCRTALSDLEVEHEEQKGHLWYVKYYCAAAQSAQSSAGVRHAVPLLIVATTRPETMLGDTAVAVHPDDERYQEWIGKRVVLPLAGREIPVIADHYVDRGFGSGVVKITPAHDFNDFEIGKKHGLEMINILTADGKINKNGGKYAGLPAASARAMVAADLETGGFLEKVEPYKNVVGHCYRCKTVVEPYLSNQWFVKTKPLAKEAVEAVKEGRTRFIPKHWEKTYFNWMENISDWCISRQIWWGHQIPAWYCEKDCEPTVSEAPPKKCAACGSTKLTQDPDVLDTWFSSALWPFSTLGWPEKTPELEIFYPTSVLVTAFDIIFFWVARMMMMGLYVMKDVPFRDVHIHALVRDPIGRKMSKSKGNVVDPLLMMKKYGTDAFRFTLASFAAQGRDIKLDEARIHGFRNFCNKIWNASRFAMMSAMPFVAVEKYFGSVDPKNRINRWILSEFSGAVQKVSSALENYEFNRAASAVYSFFWHDFCDWYLELSKEIYREGAEAEKTETAKTTFFVLDGSVRLMHPFMPFITEEIWQMLADRGGKSIAAADYPASTTADGRYRSSAEEVRLLIDVISAIRGIRQETGVPLSTDVEIFVQTTDKLKRLYEEIRPMIFKLGKVKKMGFITGDPREPAAVAVAGSSLVVIPLQGLIDVERERERQKKNAAKVEKEIELLGRKLGNSSFVNHAPPELVEEKRQQLQEATEQKELLERALHFLKAG